MLKRINNPAATSRAESVVWKEATFTFDTSVLLALFEVDSAVTEAFFELIESVSDRTWLADKVAEEYNCGVDNAISQRVEDANAAKNRVMGSFASAVNEVTRGDGKTPINAPGFFEIAEIVNALELKKTANSEILKHAKLYIERVKQDSEGLKNRIEKFFANSIGPGYSRSELIEKLGVIALRYKNQIPPGYKDKKGGANDHGDALIWFQLIDHAHVAKRPVIFVTNDLKEDNYDSVRNRARCEMVQEMYEETGYEFLVYSLSDFIGKAKELEYSSASEEVIAEAKEAATRIEPPPDFEYSYVPRFGTFAHSRSIPPANPYEALGRFGRKRAEIICYRVLGYDADGTGGIIAEFETLPAAQGWAQRVTELRKFDVARVQSVDEVYRIQTVGTSIGGDWRPTSDEV